MTSILDVKRYLQEKGIEAPAEIIYNPTYADLFHYETEDDLIGYEKARLTSTGAVSVDTGMFTGRSPKDKYFVKDENTNLSLWWNDGLENKNDNKPIDIDVWNSLKKCVVVQLSGKKLFIVDAWCGANPASRLAVRFVTEVAWQAHFVTNMFIRPSEDELEDFEPNFLVLNGSKAKNNEWKKQGLNSENFIAFNLTENIQLIGGTWYGGEMKKGMFSIMNYLLPRQGIASMHCSANVGKKGDVALFFGLSGTGKTTLSTDPERFLIGDDEHGWDADGVFNFEGGCYAKTINLDEDNEPEIYNAIRAGALLENVVIKNNGSVDFSDSSKTENTRVSYPITHINNIVPLPSRAGHASKIIFLTADAYGILPPVSRLTEEQMQYYFLSGFTAKLAGTERGVTTPQPTFSACFGAAFLTLHPTVYAETLLKRMKNAHSEVWMVNTGWNGRNQRISLADTRRIINSILNDEISQSNMISLPIFDLSMPVFINGLDFSVLDPRSSWGSDTEWNEKASDLAKLFIKNFDKFKHNLFGLEISKAGPKLLK